MPTKRNKAGQQQPYVPEGYGDASGEYAENGTESNVHYTSPDDVKKQLGYTPEQPKKESGTPKELTDNLNGKKILSLQIQKLEIEKSNIAKKLEQLKDELIIQENRPTKSLEERAKMRKQKSDYEKQLAHIETLEEREKHPNTKIFEQNNFRSNKIGGYMEGNYELFDSNLEERNNYFENSFNELEEYLGEHKGYLFRDALNKYTKGNDQDINNLLNYGTIGKDKTEEDRNYFQRLSNRINEGINNFNTPEDMTVYRSDAESWVKRNNLDKYNWDELIGKEFTEKQFLSTSLDKSISKDFDNNRKEKGSIGILFEIKIPKGKGVGIPTWNFGSFEAEQEYLLNSNSKYKITNVRNENGKIIIEQEMIK